MRERRDSERKGKEKYRRIEDERRGSGKGDE